MKKILDFPNRSYSDVSGKYQNMEKPLKHQRRLGLIKAEIEITCMIKEIWPHMKGTADFSCFKRISDAKIYVWFASHIIIASWRLYSLCFSSSLRYR